jgi:hypothetical protein
MRSCEIDCLLSLLLSSLAVFGYGQAGAGGREEQQIVAVLLCTAVLCAIGWSTAQGLAHSLSALGRRGERGRAGPTRTRTRPLDDLYGFYCDICNVPVTV